MDTIIPPALQPSALSGAILIILTIAGWIVVSRIGRLARDSSFAIADMTASITRQQLAVAESQKAINEQTLILNLMPARTELYEKLIAAIDARNNEITKNDYQHGNFSVDELKGLWIVQEQARKLFDSDVQELIASIVEELAKRDQAIATVRTNIPSSDMEPHDQASAAAWKIEELKGKLASVVLSYSSLGHVRSMPAALSAPPSSQP